MLRKRDENGEVRPSQEEMTEEYSFDELARGLASGTISRRKALKLVGSTILGAGVLAFLPDTATAAEGARCPDSGTGCTVECRGRVARRRDCRCIRTTEGDRTCVRPCCAVRNGRLRTCGDSSDCRSFEVCTKSGCCGPVSGACVPLCTEPRPAYCPATTAATQSASTEGWANSSNAA